MEQSKGVEINSYVCGQPISIRESRKLHGQKAVSSITDARKNGM